MKIKNEDDWKEREKRKCEDMCKSLSAFSTQVNGIQRYYVSIGGKI